MLTLERLQRVNAARQQEWDPTSAITIEYRGNELAGEVGELCNEIKKIARERIGIRGSRSDPQNVIKEIGDGLICLALIANHLGLSLEDCATYAFNTTSEKNGLKTRL